MISIHQPSYFPWLGLLNKIAKSETLLLMDEVQLSDSAFQNRNIFLTPDKKIKYLTIGFERKGYASKRFCDLSLLTPQAWQVLHARMLTAYYGKHPFFSEVWPLIEPVFTKQYSKLCEPIFDSMCISMGILGITSNLLYQSRLEYDRGAKKNELVIELVKAAGANCYLAGEGSRDYIRLPSFAAENIDVKWNRFKHPQYMQKNCDTFYSGLSCLDLFFNYGIQASSDLFWADVLTGPQYG
jgi:hypothetical protein